MPIGSLSLPARRTTELTEASELHRDLGSPAGQSHSLQRLAEVHVAMRQRTAGTSSIGAFASVYYAAKVLLAVFVALSRRNATPLEEEREE